MNYIGLRSRTYSEAIELLSKTNGISREVLSNLYNKRKLSSNQIGSKFGVSHSTILKLMEKYSIPRRTTPEAGQKYPKRAFSGNQLEAAYMLGFRTGDLHSVRTGYQVGLSTTSTHPAMSRLFEFLFGKYGRVGKSPSLSKGSYEWANYCYLDKSFEFLLKKPPEVPLEISSDEDLIISFLAGYLDAGGNFGIYPHGNSASFSLRVNSEDELILKGLARKLKLMGNHVYLKLEVKHGWPNRYRRDMWTLGMFRKAEILSLLPRLPLRHDEKTRWRNLMLATGNASWSQASSAVARLRAEILNEVSDYSALADSAYRNSHLTRGILPA